MIRSLVLLVALGPLTAFPQEQRRAAQREVVLALAPRPQKAARPAGGVGKRIAARAGQLVGVRNLRTVDRSMPDDCTGLVRLAYGSAGIDLMDGAGGRGDNGVTAIFRKARSRGAVHRGRPKPGDLVFFRETYDRNRDGRRNDGLTHVGIVERVEANGTITLVHRGGKGVARTRMNLRYPKMHRAKRSGAIMNDYLRSASRKRRAYVTGELFVGFASPGPVARAGAVARAR